MPVAFDQRHVGAIAGKGVGRKQLGAAADSNRGISGQIVARRRVDRCDFAALCRVVPARQQHAAGQAGLDGRQGGAAGVAAAEAAGAWA